MKIKDPVRWKVRASFVYALGTWTLFGGLGIYHFLGPKPEVKEVEKVQEPLEDTNQRREVHVTPRSKTVITYREDNFVFTSWLWGLVLRLTGGPRDK